LRVVYPNGARKYGDQLIYIELTHRCRERTTWPMMQRGKLPC
jgi:hypothetical protein